MIKPLSGGTSEVSHTSDFTPRMPPYACSSVTSEILTPPDSFVSFLTVSRSPGTC